MIKVTADTNIYMSAILFGGNPERIINLAATGKFILLLSHDILAEVAFVLRNKFGWSNYQVEQVYMFLNDTGLIVTPAKKISVIKEDDADNRILECALEGGSDYIVSGDKRHLLMLKSFMDIEIVSAARLIELLNRG
jgi:uncharacterized protein